MKFAFRTVLILGMTSFSLFFAGIYLGHMDRLFQPQPIHRAFACYPPEGSILGVLGLLGIFLSIITLIILGIIIGIRKCTSRA